MRRTLLALAMGLAAGMIATGTAFAGTYQVTACADAPPLVNNSWLPFNNNPTYLETPAHCGTNEITGFNPETSGLAAADVLGLSTQLPKARSRAGPSAHRRATRSARSAWTATCSRRPGWLPQIMDDTGAPLPGEVCPSTTTMADASSLGPQPTRALTRPA